MILIKNIFYLKKLILKKLKRKELIYNLTMKFLQLRKKRELQVLIYHDLPELRFFFQVQKNSIISFLFGFGDTNVLAKSECKQGKPDKACVRCMPPDYKPVTLQSSQPAKGFPDTVVFTKKKISQQNFYMKLSKKRF